MSEPIHAARPLFALVVLAAAACARPGPRRWVEPVTGMVFVRLPAGRFTMGSPPTEVGHEAQEERHVVVLGHAFYLARTEVTQGEWRRVMGTAPSWFRTCGADCPVESVDWFDVERFIARLSALSGVRFRLPSEAEWEYACRAGTTTPFATGENLTTDQANYDGRYPYPGFPAGVYRDRPTPVASFPPNAWGLYDMEGNVWEWTADPHCPYPRGPVRDPHGRCAAERRVIRGGSWTFDADSARCAVRYTHRPQDSGYSLGFRLARSTTGEGADALR